jgi:phospho-N-acetylmuramoyl-pentapeptide-transferase
LKTDSYSEMGTLSSSLTFFLLQSRICRMIGARMYQFILFYLRDHVGIKIPQVFFYFSTRMMLASITALLITVLLGPWFIRRLYELKIGQSIRTEECPLLGQLHSKKQNTPTMGGLLILFSMLITLVFWMDLSHIYTLILLLTTLTLGFIGGWDDYLKLKYKNAKGLSAKKKMAAQLLLSLMIGSYLFFPQVTDFVHQGNFFHPPVVKEQMTVKPSIDPMLGERKAVKASAVQIPISVKDYASRVYVPFFKEPIFRWGGVGILLALVFIAFVITGSSNAVNLTDGLDGLAAGCLIMVAICFSFIAFVSNNVDIAGYLNILYIEGSGEIAIYLAAFIGACLGFLWYNGYPAQVFMGDTGSLALGGIIGVSAILLKREVLLAVVGGIFVAEALSVILQVASYRLRNKKRIFLCAPLHHHFEYKGWPETKVVIRFWIIGLLLALIGIATLKFQ